MPKIAIIGCGKIADDHAAQIRRISGAELVGACDRELLMAKQFVERFGGGRAFTDVAELLERCRPDVVHITTPPQSHCHLACQCLESGASVYVEKPFSLTAHEALQMISLAERTGLKLTVGHDLQFSHVSRRMRSLIAGGYIGQRVIHMESYYCYDLGDARYARALLGDKNHWVRSLPGGLLHNIISHGIARIAEFLPEEQPLVSSLGFASRTLCSIGETDLKDELRVIVSAPGGPTAYFTFSSQMRPSVRQFRVFGDKGGLFLDEDKQMLLRLRGDPYKSYAERFVPPFQFAAQCVNNFKHNLGYFLKRDFHMKAGMNFLIRRFYDSVENNSPPPIPYREILLTARIMDQIFSQIGQPAK